MEPDLGEAKARGGAALKRCFKGRSSEAPAVVSAVGASTCDQMQFFTPCNPVSPVLKVLKLTSGTRLQTVSHSSLQLRILRPSLLQNRNIRISILPKRKKILVSGERPSRRSASAPDEFLACNAFARATPRCASAPVQQFQTMPLWSRIF